MKFFNSEGRCIRDTTDTEFGFNLSAPDLSDSEDETLPFDVSIRKKYAVAEGKDKISVYDPKIPVYGAKSAVESIVDETPNKTTKIVSGIISKETLADLIEGDSLEAKTLLSVIYPQKASREQDITSRVKVSYDPRNASQVKSTSDLNDRQSIDLRYQDSSKNTLSLMAELTLAEENMKHLMFAQSMEQDSGVDCGDGFLMQNDELRETVTACDYQMLRFQQEVQDLRRKYKVGYRICCVFIFLLQLDTKYHLLR